MGRVGSATTAGLVLGPALGGLLAALGGHLLLGIAAASASAFGVLWIALGVPNARPRLPEEGAVRQRLFNLSLLRDVPQIRALLVLAAVSFFALACLEGTFGRLIHHKLGFGPQEFGLIFSYEALLGVVVQGFLLTWIAKRLEVQPLLRLAYILQGVGLALTPFMPNIAGLFAASTVYAVGSSVASPTLNSLCSKVTPEERHGEMFGVLQSARSFGFLFGPILGGILFDWRPEAPYLLAGFVAVGVGLALTVRTTRSLSPTS
jgi:MFS family permease